MPKVRKLTVGEVAEFDTPIPPVQPSADWTWGNRQGTAHRWRPVGDGWEAACGLAMPADEAPDGDATIRRCVDCDPDAPAPASVSSAWLRLPAQSGAHLWQPNAVREDGRAWYVALCGKRSPTRPTGEDLGHGHCRACEVFVEQRPDPRPPLAEVFAAMDSGAPLTIILSLIDDNPYQPRLVYDDERIGVIAASIREHGLLQVPLARRMPNGRYQLAFGHSRLRAFRKLAAVIPSDVERWGRMPLVIRELGDQTMALHAWSENKDRKDLSSYEEARAIERYTTAFGWTQREAAEKLQLDRSTVANKLRLLRLPDSALKQLQDGQLSERQALALLPLTELPEQALRVAEQGYGTRPSRLWQEAPELSSDAIRGRVEQIMSSATHPIGTVAWRKHDFGDVKDMAIVSPRCADCRLMSGQGNAARCAGPDCYTAKDRHWSARRLRDAAAKLGIPAVDKEPTHSAAERFYSGEEFAEQIRTRGCDKLRVCHGSSGLPVPGYPELRILCLHGQGKRCGCLQSVRQQQSKTDPVKIDERARKKEAAALFEQAITALTGALADGQTAAWRRVLRQVSYDYKEETTATWDLGQVQRALATAILKSAVYNRDYPEHVRSYGGKLLTAVGLPPPWADTDEGGVCAQTPTADEPAPAPQSTDPFYAPAAQMARDRAAALGMVLAYEDGWMLGDDGPMSWPDLKKRLAQVEGASLPAQTTTVTIRTDGGERTIEATRLTSDLALHPAIAADGAWTISHRASGYAIATLRTQDAGERALSELAELDWTQVVVGQKVDSPLRDSIVAVLARYKGDIVRSFAPGQVAQETAAPEPAAPSASDPLVLVREMLATAERQLADATTCELAGPVLKAVRDRLEQLVDAPGVDDATYEALIRQVLAAQERLTAPALQEASV